MSEEKKAFFDKANLTVNVIAMLAVPLCCYALSLRFDLVKTTIESDAKDTYTTKVESGKMEQHLDFVDQRENADREKHDLEIQQLQDRSSRTATTAKANGWETPGGVPQAWNVGTNNNEE